MEKKLSHFWNTRSPEQRLELVLHYHELFWSLGLVTESELKVLYGTSKTNRPYVIQREKTPFFTRVNLKQILEEQIHYEKLKTALSAIFKRSESSGKKGWNSAPASIHPAKA